MFWLEFSNDADKEVKTELYSFDSYNIDFIDLFDMSNSIKFYFFLSKTYLLFYVLSMVYIKLAYYCKFSKSVGFFQ